VRERLERRDGWVALAIYAALALILDRGAVAHMNSVCPCGLPGDPAQYLWAFDWFPHALLHGLNPLYSRAMWTPTGINLAGAGAVPFLAFALAPVTWLAGPIVSLNVVLVAAPILNSWAAYWLCRHLTRAPWVSMLAGLMYGFSTYSVTEASGHLHLAIVFCLPLIAFTVVKAVEGGYTRRRAITQLTILLLIQMYISTEVMLTMSVVGAVLLAASWGFGSKEQRARVLTVVPWLIAAYLITAALSSWYLYELLKAPAYAKGQGLFYPTDALAFSIPNPTTWLGGAQFAPVTKLFVGGTGETLVYIGVPMILVAARFIWTRWSNASTKAITVALAVTIFWILGGRLVIAGQATIRLPYSLVNGLPLLNEVMQGRVALEFTLLCTVVLALWLARPASGRPPVLRWGAGLLAVAFVLPNFADHPTSAWTNPTFFHTSMYKRYLKPGETIMPIAWGGFSESPMWQAEDHMYWNMANGYFLFPPPVGWVNQLTDDLWTDTPTAADAPLLRQFVVERRVSEIVVQASELQRWSPTLRQAGLHASARVGGVTLYRVPSSWVPRTAAS
jgi:hypothetical protein